MMELVRATDHEWTWLNNRDFKTYQELDKFGALSLQLKFPQSIFMYKGNATNPYRIMLSKNARNFVVGMKIENEHIYTINKSYEITGFDNFDLINIDGLGSILVKFQFASNNRIKILIKAHKHINILRDDAVKNQHQVKVLKSKFNLYRR